MRSSGRASRRAAMCSAKSQWRRRSTKRAISIARARSAGRIHAVVQNRRYVAGVRRIARALKGGAIGDIASVHADFFLAPHFGGFREDMDHVLLLDMAIHTFDALRCMTGLRRPRASIAANGTRLIPGTGRDRRPQPSSNSRPARSSSIAAAGARKGCQRRGNPRGVSSERKARSFGTAPTRSASKLSVPASARGSSTR